MKIIYGFFFGVVVFVSVIFKLSMINQTVNTFKVTSSVVLEVSHNSKELGTIEIGLFGDDAPKTVANFRELCLNGVDGMSYKGTPFHRVIDKFIVQGGDVVHGDGRGSISIYGTYFEDENLEINHTDVGFVGMANQGPDTNGCQFYITAGLKTPWLDGKHTIFGKVVHGQRVVHMIEKAPTDSDDRPLRPVIVEDCKDKPVSSPYWISDNPYDFMGWVRASAVPLGMSFTILSVFQYFINKLDTVTGNMEKIKAQ